MMTFQMPEQACNAHLHIVDPAFPNDGKAAAQRGTAEEYRTVADRYGLARAVFVQAKTFALDNSCLLDAIRRFGAENARGVAVVDGNVTDAELRSLHEAGVRGLRFSVWNPGDAVVAFEDCVPLSERVRELGWNIQFHMGAKQIALHADTIRRLRCKIVFDHMGRLDPALGVKDPTYPFLLEMVDRGSTWIKLSGPYLNTVAGYPWEDADATASAIAAYAPERVVWGSDWPHVTEKTKPDEGRLVSQIRDWLPTERARRLALVENPAELYFY